MSLRIACIGVGNLGLPVEPSWEQIRPSIQREKCAKFKRVKMFIWLFVLLFCSFSSFPLCILFLWCNIKAMGSGWPIHTIGQNLFIVHHKGNFTLQFPHCTSNGNEHRRKEAKSFPAITMRMSANHLTNRRGVVFSFNEVDHGFVFAITLFSMDLT